MFSFDLSFGHWPKEEPSPYSDRVPISPLIFRQYSSFFLCCCWPSGVVLLFILFGDTVLLVPLFQFLFWYQRASDSLYLDPRAPHLHRAAHHYHCPPPDPTRSALSLLPSLSFSLAHCPTRSLLGAACCSRF